MKKKLVTVVASLTMGMFALSGILVGCNRGGGGVGIFSNSMSDAYRGSVARNIKDIFDKQGVTNTIFDANDNQNQQNQDVESAIANGMTGMLIAMPSTSQTQAMLTRAENADIPLIMWSSEPEQLKDLEVYNRAFLVSTLSKDAGIINAQILERNMLGISEEGLTIDDIDTAWVEANVASGKLKNDISKYANRVTGDTVAPDVEGVRTVLVDAQLSQTGSTDRTRAGLTSFNLFYEAISIAAQDSEDQAIKDMFPVVNTTELKELKFTGAGLRGKFIPNRYIQYCMDGILKYHTTIESTNSGNPEWSDTGIKAGMTAYLTQYPAPELVIGGSDRMTQGAINALNENGDWNEATNHPDYSADKVIPIVSTDGSDEWGVPLLKNGQIWGTAFQDPVLMATLSAQMMNNLLAGATTTEDILKDMIVNGVQIEFDNGLDASSDGTDEGIVENRIIRMPMVEFKLP